jgi:hypothetical protein
MKVFFKGPKFYLAGVFVSVLLTQFVLENKYVAKSDSLSTNSEEAVPFNSDASVSPNARIDGCERSLKEPDESAPLFCVRAVKFAAKALAASEVTAKVLESVWGDNGSKPQKAENENQNEKGWGRDFDESARNSGDFNSVGGVAKNQHETPEEEFDPS